MNKDDADKQQKEATNIQQQQQQKKKKSAPTLRRAGTAFSSEDDLPHTAKPLRCPLRPVRKWPSLLFPPGDVAATGDLIQ